jgi:hypothetical protein
MLSSEAGFSCQTPEAAGLRQGLALPAYLPEVLKSASQLKCRFGANPACQQAPQEKEKDK